ncbi:uncharacterized protein [Hemitrygon akajei]|uniref:uncharacterized protein isoform X1 n=1 Tax=Hemitrygon akajei TaxID=2704970 RepID=UPI003BF9E03D
MSEPRTPRFSDRAVQVLLEQVRARREIFFPSEGRSVPREKVHQAWMEVAHWVNAKSEVPKTWLQCRKKFNGLTWTAKEKLAHKTRKRTSCGERPASILDLTQMEQEALDIIGPNSRRNLENGKAGGQVPQDLTHYLGFIGQEMEEEHFTEDAQSPAPSFHYISTDLNISSGMDGQLNGSSHNELFSSNEQELNIVERTVQETDDSRATSGPNCIEEDKDADLTGPAFRRKIFHEHHQLLQALDKLPKSCLTLSESVEESASIFCGVVAQGITTLQSTMERVANSVDAAMKPSVHEPVAPTLASLIEAQTSAIQALACTISTSLERLGGRIDRGFGHISDLLQSALPQLNGGIESQPHVSGPAGVSLASLSRGNSTYDPSPSPEAPSPPEAPLNLQVAVRSPRGRALRGRRP